jgi:IPT/TIG domain
MAFFKRHLGLRVEAVAVVSALVALSLEAPTSAASPTISSFSPTSGPTGCVVVITGTNFKDPIVTSVDIDGTPVSAFKVVSGKEIWATVGGDASGTIHVTNASATASSAIDFTNANPGAVPQPSRSSHHVVDGLDVLRRSSEGTSSRAPARPRPPPWGATSDSPPTWPRRPVPGHRTVRGNSVWWCRRAPPTDGFV